MKWIIMLWLMTAGFGISYAVYEERNHRIKLLKEMEQSLGKLSYFMYEWRLPLEEALAQMLKEPFPLFRVFYEKILEEVLKRNLGNIGELWEKNSFNYFKNISLQKEIKELWAGCFINIPMEPEALKNGLTHRREQLKAYLADLQDKYKVEQKLVWTLGVCASAFLCLIIW